MSATLDRAYDIACSRRARVVMPEREDPRIAAAADILERDGLAEVVPLSPVKARHVDAMLSQRPMREAIARRLLNRPMMRAAAMVATGEAELMVAGAVAPTKRVIEAASMVIGLDDSTRTPSSFFLMVMPDGRELIFADCAVNVAPDAAQLADIARASADTAKGLLGHAEVALLSFSTQTSGAGASVDKVSQTAEITGFRGPIQADAALDPMIARQKGEDANQPANVLIFPDLDAGNIAYKLMVKLAGAQAYGPILQGFRRPICDLSRGTTVDEIVTATVLAIACGRLQRGAPNQVP